MLSVQHAHISFLDFLNGNGAQGCGGIGKHLLAVGNRVLQFLFSMLHPWIAFGFGNGWSRSNRLSHDKEYVFGGKDEPLYKFAESYLLQHEVDFFVFGHYHDDVCLDMPSGAQFRILKDWMDSSPYLCFDGERFTSIK